MGWGREGGGLNKELSTQNVAVFNIFYCQERHKKGKKILKTIMVILFLDFFIFYQSFISPQKKWSVIISNNNDMQEFPLKLPNNLKLRNLTIVGYPGKM